jgi:hypothetical protein
MGVGHHQVLGVRGLDKSCGNQLGLGKVTVGRHAALIGHVGRQAALIDQKEFGTPMNMDKRSEPRSAHRRLAIQIHLRSSVDQTKDTRL